MAEIPCPSCSKRLRVNPQSKSRRLRCPVCQTEMSLSVSGETVTAKVLSAGPIPEPPPLPPPPVPPPLPIRAAEPAMDEPPPFEEPAPPQPVLQFSATPRTTTRSTSSERSRPGKTAEGAHNNLGLWIGGGIGLLIVAILAACGFLLIGGIPSGSGKTAAQSPKAGEGKHKPAVKPKDILEEPSPTIDHNKKATLPVNDAVSANTSLPLNASLPLNTGPLKSFPPAADFSPPGLTGSDETFTGPLPRGLAPEATPKPTTTPQPETPPLKPGKPSEKPAPAIPTPEKPASEKPAVENPAPALESANAPDQKID